MGVAKRTSIQALLLGTVPVLAGLLALHRGGAGSLSSAPPSSEADTEHPSGAELLVRAEKAPGAGVPSSARSPVEGTADPGTSDAAPKKKPSAILGRVVDFAGRPAPGTRVSLLGYFDGGSWAPCEGTTTDAVGEFAFDRRPEATLRLHARRSRDDAGAGGSASSGDFRLGSTGEPLRIPPLVLGGEGRLAGRARFPDGAPAGVVWLVFRWTELDPSLDNVAPHSAAEAILEGGDGLIGELVCTEPDGTFHLDGLHAGTFTARLFQGRDCDHPLPTISTGAVADVVLPHYRVTALFAGEPGELKGTRVSLEQAATGTELLGWVDASGRFQAFLSSAGEVRLRGASEGAAFDQRVPVLEGSYDVRAVVPLRRDTRGTLDVEVAGRGGAETYYAVRAIDATTGSPVEESWYGPDQRALLAVQPGTYRVLVVPAFQSTEFELPTRSGVVSVRSGEVTSVGVEPALGGGLLVEASCSDGGEVELRARLRDLADGTTRELVYMSGDGECLSFGRRFRTGWQVDLLAESDGASSLGVEGIFRPGDYELLLDGDEVEATSAPVRILAGRTNRVSVVVHPSR